MINIKYLPKDVLLYKLWKRAKVIPYFRKPKIELILTKERAKKDALSMKKGTYLTYYYGRTLFVDITQDDLDYTIYNMQNGRDAAQKVVRKLKTKELKRLCLRYYVM